MEMLVVVEVRVSELGDGFCGGIVAMVWSF